MYTHIWNKYLPIIRILLKKSASGDQTLNLNRIDFERAGTGRKAGYKFTIQLNNGRVANVISTSPLAMDLAAVLLEDAVVKELVRTNNYEVSLNTKFQVSLKNTTPAEGRTGVDKEEGVSSETNGE
ncbi:MAG TPA: hypothetical protein VGM41_22050 [Chitinophagaceae bacterium]|jgi:hypothetical protein